MRYTEAYWESVGSAISSIPHAGRLAGKKVLVTGANGMICSAVVDALMCLNDRLGLGVGIYAASRSRERLANRFGKCTERDDFFFVEYDALKPFCFEGRLDFIIHGAGNADPKAIMAEPVETMAANIEGTRQLLEYAARHTDCRLLYVSSSEVYGKRQSREPYKEGDYGYVDLLDPRSCYPSAKRAAETLCVSYNKEYATDTVIVRPGHVYGPTMTARDSRASSQFAREAMDGKDIVMKTPGTQLRSYCYVVDCATAILAVLLNGNSGEAYNISNRDSVVTIRQMAEAFAEAGGVRLVFEAATEAEMSGYNAMDNSSLDASKLESLGWKALTNMEEGAAVTIKSKKVKE